MSRREGLGSWLEGTPEPGPDRGGARLGLPASGPGSQAGLGRRAAALSVDWLLSLAVSAGISSEPGALPLVGGSSTVTLAVFAVSTAVLVGLLGHTIGHRLVGLRVVRLRDLVPGAASGAARDPKEVPPPGPLAGLLRTVLLCLVIPAVVWDGSGRGLHDVAAGTVVVRR